MTTTRPSRPVVLLRPVPGDSVIHRLWAGTKLLTVFVLSALLTFYPGWVGIGAVAAVVVLAAALARIPFGVLPSVPKVLWLLIAFGAFTAALSGGEPIVQLFDTNVALGGLLTFTRVTTLAVVLGAILYRFFIALALNSDFIGLKAQDLNLVTAVLVTIALVIPQLKRKFAKRGA